MQSHPTEKTEHNCIEKSFVNNRNKNLCNELLATYDSKYCVTRNLQSAFHKVETGSPLYYQYTMSCRLARNSITKTGRFLTSPSLNVLPVKSSFEARHLLTIHESRWNIFLMASYKYVFNGATVKQWFQTTKQYQRISYHISIQNNLRKEVYLIRNSLKTSDIVTNTNPRLVR